MGWTHSCHCWVWSRARVPISRDKSEEERDSKDGGNSMTYNRFSTCEGHQELSRDRRDDTLKLQRDGAVSVRSCTASARREHPSESPESPSSYRLPWLPGRSPVSGVNIACSFD